MGLNKIYMNFTCFVPFFNVTTRKFKITFRACFCGSHYIYVGPHSSTSNHYLDFFSFIIYFIDYAISCPIFPPLFPSAMHTPSHPHSPPFSSCPWVILISSLASTFSILFLPSSYFLPTIHATYSLYLFPPLPLPLPADNSP